MNRGTMLSHLPCCAGFVALQLHLARLIARDPGLLPCTAPNVVDEAIVDGHDVRIDVQYLAIDEVLGSSLRQDTARQRRIHRVAVHRYVQSLGIIDRLRLGPVWLPLLLLARALGGGLRVSYVGVLVHNVVATGRRDVLPGSCSVWPLVHLTSACPPPNKEDDSFSYPGIRMLPVNAAWDTIGDGPRAPRQTISAPVSLCVTLDR